MSGPRAPALPLCRAGPPGAAVPAMSGSGREMQKTPVTTSQRGPQDRRPISSATAWAQASVLGSVGCPCGSHRDSRPQPVFLTTSTAHFLPWGVPPKQQSAPSAPSAAVVSAASLRGSPSECFRRPPQLWNWAALGSGSSPPSS